MHTQFRNVAFILVGDLHQLPPPFGSPLFGEPKFRDEPVSLLGLLFEWFKLHKLDCYATGK